MNRDRFAGRFRWLRQAWGRLRRSPASAEAQASEKQLAEWRAGRHKIDPIHK